MENLKSKSCLIYTRCSTEDQGKRTSHEYQKRECTSFAERNGMTILGYYSDTITGTSFDNRINLNMAYDFCRNNQVDFVIVYKMDRFGRDTGGAISTIGRFSDIGTEVNFSDEWVDYSDPTWPLTRNIKMGLAETESRKISDRTKDGIYQRKIEGYWPHAAVPVGYKRQVTDEKKMNGNYTSIVVIDEVKGPVVTMIFELYAAFSMNKADLFSLYGDDLEISRSAFYRMFDKPFYKGFYHCEKYKHYLPRIVKGRHEPLVSEAIWDAVQQRSLAETSDAKGKTWYHKDSPDDTDQYFLKGLIYCPRSSMKMTAGRNRGKLGKYYHYYSTPSGLGRVNIPVKLAHSVTTAAVTELVMKDEVFQALETKVRKLMKIKMNKIAGNLERLRLDQKSLITKKDKAMEDYFQGMLCASLYQEMANKLDTKAKRIGVEMNKLSYMQDRFETSMISSLHKLKDLRNIYAMVGNKYKYSILSAIFPDGFTIDKETRTLRTPGVNIYMKEMLRESVTYEVIKEDGSLNFASVASRVDEAQLFEIHFNLFVNAMKLVS